MLSAKQYRLAFSREMSHERMNCARVFPMKKNRSHDVPHFPLGLFAVLILIVCTISQCMAQQNLFNIPSGDITPKGKFFYQHQLNFYSTNDFESKSHLVYGLGKSWDVGINLVDVPIRLVDDRRMIGFNDYKGRKPLYPLLMAALQKQVVINPHWAINIGTQVGPNLTSRLENKTVAHFTYATARWHPFQEGYFIAGPYYSNRVFTGGRQHTVGFMFGYEIPIGKKISLMGDFISGTHKKSNSTFGAVIDVGKRTQLCVAALLPYPNQNLPGGLVLELNIFGWDFQQHH